MYCITEYIDRLRINMADEIIKAMKKYLYPYLTNELIDVHYIAL